MVKTKKINSILIANRGEIATRIIRTAKKLRIKTIAIYSDLDKDAPFTRFADTKIALNEYASYLNSEKIVKIAKDLNVDAIHPGYGFLSENIDFVKLVEKNGISFIGPSSNSMELVGDKFNAKQIIEKLEVPTAKCSKNIILTGEQAKEEARKIGYPVMFKAVAGGGGKGIRVVYKEEEIEEQLKSAKYEAKTIYKNDAILLEKYIKNPRHIEIQIIADKYGNIVCLGERECSIQRFNQKIVEEAPSVAIDEDTRQKMYECCKKIVKQCKYYSAGTIEFLLDKDKNFYFLEMNTRIQVEHIITEFITGLDIVELMIKIEEGCELPFSQEDINLKGHSIECRICAENPSKNFIPSNGQIIHYIEPYYDENVRVESSVELGSDITPNYDSMIAKLITYGNTRNEAIETMKTALSQYEIEGIETNINFLESIFRQENFIKGNINTNFIKDNYPNGFNSLHLTNNVKKAFITTSVALYIQELRYEFGTHKNCYIPRDTEISDLYVLLDNEPYLISIIEYTDEYLKIKYNEEEMHIKFNYQRGDLVFKSSLNGVNPFSIKIKKSGYCNIMYCSGLCSKVGVYKPSTYELLKYTYKENETQKPKFLLSPITGKIIEIHCKEGQILKPGDKLISISSMKLDNLILCEYETKIVKIFYNKNDNVKTNDKIIEFEYK